MIEVIYKEEKQEAKGNEGIFAIPRNIRQIGLASETYRIYVEDYVYTFLVRLAGMDAKGEKESGHLAVLTGEAKWQSGVTYVFVRGAITVDKTEAAADHIDFSDKVWARIHDEQELYFPGQEIVGWFFAQQELPLKITEVFKRVHLKHFGGGEKVLMLMDPAEREDAFFRYENSFLVRQPGYYLFYEKNPSMQNYMLDKNQEVIPEKTEEVPDEAVKAFRTIIRAKKKTRKEEKQERVENVETLEQDERPSVFSYAATACLAIALLAVGVNFYRNYQIGYSPIQEIQTTSATAGEKITDGPTKEQKSETAPVPTAAAKITQQPTLSPEITKELSNTAITADEKNGNTGNVLADETVTENKTNTEYNDQLKNSEVQNLSENQAADSEKSTGKSQNTETELETGTTGQTEEEAQVYQEESDVRKAIRKQALAEQEEESAVQDDTETGAVASGGTAHASYVIRPGDTLYQISMEKYGNMEAISEICRLNGISQEEIIYPGQIIVLP